MFWSKKNYVKEMVALAEAKKIPEISALLQEAFTKEAKNESLLASLCEVIHEYDLQGFAQVHEEFLRRFPDSSLAVRAYWVNVLARKRAYDDATFGAIEHLCLKKTHGLHDLMSDLSCIQALLPATAAFSNAGARSFSASILKFGLSSKLPQAAHLRPHFEKELQSLQSELSDPALKALDQKWSEFFVDGRNLLELLAVCEQRKMPLLRQRVIHIELEKRFTVNVCKDFEHFFLRTANLIQVLALDLKRFWLVSNAAKFEKVLDLTDPAVCEHLGLKVDEFYLTLEQSPKAYETPHIIGSLARSKGFDGIVVSPPWK